MIRVMYDSDTPWVLVGLSPLVATYSDLATPALVKTFADNGQTVVWIDRGHGDPMGLATCADVERGAMTTTGLGNLLGSWHKNGRKNLATYCDRSSLPAVDQATQGISHYRWVATLDGTMHVAGYQAGRTPAAVQFGDAAMTGFHADVSLVFEPGWHRQAGSGQAGQLVHEIAGQVSLIGTYAREALSDLQKLSGLV